jgi:hypothetical protein
MSYDRYISPLKELQTKPPSINSDRKGANFVVFRFLQIKRANSPLYPTLLKSRINEKHPWFFIPLLIVVMDPIELKVTNHDRYQQRRTARTLYGLDGSIRDATEIQFRNVEKNHVPSMTPNHPTIRPRP